MPCLRRQGHHGKHENQWKKGGDGMIWDSKNDHFCLGTVLLMAALPVAASVVAVRLIRRSRR
jgi:hypothetical protein